LQEISSEIEAGQAVQDSVRTHCASLGGARYIRNIEKDEI
jgi:hypothetical protein